MIVPFNGTRPSLDPSAYIHASAQIVGDVYLGAEASVWLNVVVRGDVHHVRIGALTNLQDGTIVHVTGGRWPTIIGESVTVGHGVILHGCTVYDRCLIGIGAIVLDGAEIGPDCLVAAGSLVSPRTKIPPGHLAMGSPAKAVRLLRDAELDEIRRSAARYVEHAANYRAQGW